MSIDIDNLSPNQIARLPETDRLRAERLIAERAMRAAQIEAATLAARLSELEAGNGGRDLRRLLIEERAETAKLRARVDELTKSVEVRGRLLTQTSKDLDEATNEIARLREEVAMLRSGTLPDELTVEDLLDIPPCEAAAQASALGR